MTRRTKTTIGVRAFAHDADARGSRWARTLGAVALPLLLAVAMSGCDVTNPGPVQDDFLNLPASHEALVNGSGRELVEAFGNLAYTGVLPTHELFPGGQTAREDTARASRGARFRRRT